ncbi:GIY-YIG nuclease family protein [Pseudomonas sp. MYb118]|uniref:GIY-YIG nuclease family protein n=1 Tax=Pseudomonas sp. MYb118 TaxID=1848720 RepID=UPI0034D00983
MVTFNFFLSSKGLDLSRVRLVRHQDQRAERGKTPYDLWVADDGRFEQYQAIQNRDVFGNAGWVASFVATPLNETLFVGLYRVVGQSLVPAETRDPVTGEDVSGLLWYDMQPDDSLDDYKGRLVIEWGPGLRSWVQRADNQDKKVLEMRRVAIEPPFPGFGSFRWPVRELTSIPVSWRTALSVVRGVYALTCLKTGKLYVGSAYGEEGFWGRWLEYLSTGHGGNIGLKALEEHEFQVAILEVSSSAAGATEIIAREGEWKEKLLTRRFGLNIN